ncbi:MAG: ABC transporter substrate-binding protein [Phycisphaeraceae bacterium]|nr:ABC transporter substrate-binding protein [Phycisphaeraceae bacterium]
MKALLRAALPPVTIVMALLLLWEGAVRLFQPAAYLLPGPIDVVRALVGDAERLLSATGRTALSALLGFLFAGVGGVVLGTVLSMSRFLERGFYPLATLFQMVPLVALAPLLVIWFHYGLGATIAASAIVAIFPVLANTLDGLRSVDPGLRELFSMARAGRVVTWWKLGLPASTPQIITGLRIAAGLAVIGTIVGEFVSGYAGRQAPLGVVILSAMRENRADLVFASIALSSLVGLMLFGMVGFGGWLFLRRWHASGNSAEGRVVRAVVWLLAVGVVLSLVSGGCERRSGSDAGSSERTRVTLQLNWVPEPEFGGIYAAQAIGAFDARGLEVEIIKGGAGTATPQLIASGACDFGVVSADQILQIREQGGDLVAIYAIFQQSPVGIMVHEANPITSIRELWTSRSTVAVEPGLPYVAYLNRRYGEGGVTLVPYGGALALFARDPAFAQQCFISAEPVQMQLQGVPVRVLPVAESGYDPYTAVIAVRRSTLERRPEVVEKMVDALREAWRAYLDDPARFNPAIAALNPAMSLEAMNIAAEREHPLIETEWTREHGLGSMDPERWRELAAQMRELGLIRGTYEPATLMR